MKKGWKDRKKLRKNKEGKDGCLKNEERMQKERMYSYRYTE